jgi:hypothetical protein
MPGGPYYTTEQGAALRRLAAAIVTDGIDGLGRLHALRDLLLSEPPRIAGVPLGDPLQDGSLDIERLNELVAGLDHSYLFIQGPPGSGKTWTGAQLAVHLLGLGARVGIAATSHKAIHNLVHEIEAAATERQVNFRGWKKCSADNPASEYDS